MHTAPHECTGRDEANSDRDAQGSSVRIDGHSLNDWLWNLSTVNVELSGSQLISTEPSSQQTRAHLFEKKALAAYFGTVAGAPIPSGKSRRERLAGWIDNIKGAKSNKKFEAQYEGKFITDVFGSVLGYTQVPDASATLWVKPPPGKTGLSGTPDAVLGDFADQDAPRFLAVVELKSPGTDLDKPQAGYKDKKTPVEQAFEYGEELLGCRWVIVSDMRMIRLYSIDDAELYYRFELSQISTSLEAFEHLWHLLNHSQLIEGGANSSVSELLARSLTNRTEISSGFYSAYIRIRADLYAAIKVACEDASISATPHGLLSATQRLLDRLLFIFYCQDHPHHLIPTGTVSKVVDAARAAPGASETRIYDYLKGMFAEVDAGSPAASGLKVFGYNGELFKKHPIIDQIDLPDSLNNEVYEIAAPRTARRTVRGVWGLNAFDFWSELDERVLGRVFEESLSDLELVAGDVDIAARLAERKAGGVFYTSNILSDFVAERAIRGVYNDRVVQLSATSGDDPDDPDVRIEALQSLRIADLTCGSGAFIVASYKVLQKELNRLQSIKYEGDDNLLAVADKMSQSALLASCLYGIDLLPQAIEIAKLALWLRSARRDEKVPDLSKNLTAGNALNLDTILPLLGRDAPLGKGSLDLVIGNPPWGADMPDDLYTHACSLIGIDPTAGWDSWEVFVMLGLWALKPGGRLSLVLPDSLLYEDKERIRTRLLNATTIVRLHSLGPAWFGPTVRMSTTVLEVVKQTPPPDNSFKAVVLAGKLRKQAIDGRVPLTQIETQRSRSIPQARSASAPAHAIEVFRSVEDDQILDTIKASSATVESITESGRGEEMAKSGVYWICPGCLLPTTPGRTRKGGAYDNKTCPSCAANITAPPNSSALISEGDPKEAGFAPWLDGDDITRRYTRAQPRQRIRTDLAGWSYKDESLYTSPKVLIRQAGVGIVAGLDETGARVPQSVYYLRTNGRYSNEYLLAALQSRTVAYVAFKWFGELDPDKAHAKLTLTRIKRLPVPKIDFADPKQKALHDQVTADARLILARTEKFGGPADLRIELALRKLWGLDGNQSAYINREFRDIPRWTGTT